MSDVFATEMVDMKVLSTDGDNVGTLSNLVIDQKTGDVVDMIVKLDLDADRAGLQVTDRGLALVPFESITAIKDYIVIDRNRG
ncbi:MAG: PRC-barrel domain-containing protein [Halobacteriota archaeon]|nr:PRC-barrel domain-containing protein [Halobacteriota archaeon]MDY6958121.1 PRC-barrel domain-containing protein [Halobacteriota archaeon]